MRAMRRCYIAYDPQEDTETVAVMDDDIRKRAGYIAYDPQEDTETRQECHGTPINDCYIAYDPQEDTETIIHGWSYATT